MASSEERLPAPGYISTLKRRFLLRFPGSRQLMRDLEKDVLCGDSEQAFSFVKSLHFSCNMTAIAGAILAQISITAISLPELKATHWTVEALFMASLMFALGSIYTACLLSESTKGLNTIERVRDWFSQSLPPVPTRYLQRFLDKAELQLLPDTASNDRDYSNPKASSSDVERAANFLSTADVTYRELRRLQNLSTQRRKEEKIWTTRALTVPGDLLTSSVLCLLYGLLTYFFVAILRELFPEYVTWGTGFIFGTIWAIALYTVFHCLMLVSKRQETLLLNRLNRLTHLPQKRENGTIGGGVEAPSSPEHSMIARDSAQGHVISGDISDHSLLALAPVNHSEEISISPEPRPSLEYQSNISIHNLDRDPLTGHNSNIHHIANNNAQLQTSLAALLRAHEETLAATRRLMEAFQTGQQSTQP